MGLTATLRAAMVTAIAGAGDTAQQVTYNGVALGAYDVATDTIPVTLTTKTFTTFVYGLSDTEVDWFQGDLNMQKMIVNHDDLGFSPKAEDYVLIGGVRWEVAKFKAFPNNVGYVVFLRKT